jgi:hypothetical protein|uniref:Uncharacterized protein n=1 Tax=viral metagenome TaxID=1070528 RepID=A0A6C0D0A8_9ZZZZ
MVISFSTQLQKERDNLAKKWQEFFTADPNTQEVIKKDIQNILNNILEINNKIKNIASNKK